MFEPELFRKQMYCTEESTCDIVRTFRAPAVIPHRGSAPGELWPLPPFFAPLVTARSDAPQQTMALSSNQRHTGTFGFGGEEENE